MLHDLSFIATGMPWPPPEEAPRLRDYAKNRLLWNNKHDQVEGYGDWFRLLREEYGVTHEIIFGFHRRVSTLFADLTFGDAPTIDAGSEDLAAEQPLGSPSGELPARGGLTTQIPRVRPMPADSTGDRDPAQDTIDRIMKFSNLQNVGKMAVIDGSRFGTAVFKLRLKNRRGYIQAQDPSIWFPVVSRDDHDEVLYHVLAWAFEVGETDYLRAEIHEKGKIVNRLFWLENGVIKDELPPDRFKQFFPNRQSVEDTRLDDFMVKHVTSLKASDEFYGQDDYEPIDSLLLEYMARMGLLSKVQDRHSDPSVYGDEGLRTRNAKTGEWEVELGHFLPVKPGGTVPGYMTWDASQQQVFSFMDRLKDDLYEISETTPTAFGRSSTGYAESGTSLRLRMVPPLLKAKRITESFEPVVEEMLILAARLEAAWGVEGAVVPSSINIAWKDGLPEDPGEQAEIEATRQSSGTASRESSVRRLDGGTNKEIQEELERIEDDRASTAATRPATALDLFGDRPNDRAGAAANGGTNDASTNGSEGARR